MTIGDVLAVVAGIGSTCVAAWALLLGMALLFHRRAGLAQQNFERSPWRVLATGFVLALLGIGGTLVLLNQPNGILKLAGWALLLGVLGLSALGASGLALLLGNCVQRSEPTMSDFGALLRGAGLLIAAALVPLLGWFFIVPLTIIMSAGAGWCALRGRVPAKNQAVIPYTPQMAPIVAQAVQTTDELTDGGRASHNSAEAVT
ncbi:MAG TPA: hypothetical protein VF600_14365 [Abditibacteriaceae bacterium]|jgi:hypothetical protein